MNQKYSVRLTMLTKCLHLMQLKHFQYGLVTSPITIVIYHWMADTYIKVKINVPTRSLVQESIITPAGSEVKASDYYAAAVYYREENMMLDQALVRWKIY